MIFFFGSGILRNWRTIITFLSLACGLFLGNSARSAVAKPADAVRLVIDGALPLPAQRAVDRLTASLEDRGFEVIEQPAVDPTAQLNLVLGVCGQSSQLDALVAEHKLQVPEADESLLVARVAENPATLVVAGRDERGLAYAVYELADAIRLAPAAGYPLDAIRPVVESPHLRVRSFTTQVFNQAVERHWYESEEYWHWFFAMLARNRVNNYSLTFGHNANYMIPPYAWLFEVAEYPQVRVRGVDDAQREQNLKRLQRITELANEYGVDFTIGLWTQLPVVKVREGLDFGESPVENLPSGTAGGDYCAKGLQKLLQLCPHITGVQMRMNLESGIPHDKQEEYYQAQFTGIANCGRPVKLDLRYKSLSQRTIDLAKGKGLDVNVSTKYWCEHMGLPFHPTEQDPAYSPSRYGYGTMLHYPRNYSVTYRLWNVGSSRLLLWGDPDYAARFARSCTLGGGEGFEVFAPLNYKGYGNSGEAWQIHADEKLKHYRWEYERYWAYFLTFGRWGYNPDTPITVWQRELDHHFAGAGQQLDRAYRLASQVLPLITATTQFSANGWRLWPEMNTCMHLDAYRASPPGDYAQFYAIAPFVTRQQWRSEDWAAKPNAFVQDAISGNLNSKWTPVEVCNLLTKLADETESALDEAQSQLSDKPTGEWLATELDFRVLANLARYHAAKKQAAMHLEFFRLTNDKLRLVLVWQHILQSQQAWQQIVELTDGKYRDDMVLGHSHEHHSDFLNRLHIHCGHWRDRLVDVQQDVDFVTELLKKNQVELEVATQQLASMRRYPAEVSPTHRPRIVHQPVTTVASGELLPLSVRVESEHPLRHVLVHYRAMDQTSTWKQIEMQRSDDGSYAVQVPANEFDPRFDLLYYIEARVENGGALWPNWQEEDPYVAVTRKR
jgi:hypothetical protein